MYTVVFRQNENEIKTLAQPGQNLLEVARACGVDIDAPCSGNGLCGKCRIRLIEGALEGGRGRQLSEAELSDGVRLACESTVCADAVIEVPVTAGSFRVDIIKGDLAADLLRQSQVVHKHTRPVL